jgi:GT2 family glycosyltransferase
VRISVIVPTYKRAPSLRRCLQSLRAQDHPDFEILVVDDGSRDGSAEAVRSEFPEVRVFVQTRNLGPAAARNRGIRAATGELLAFTDDDCVPPTDWLRRHELLHAEARVGAAGGPQVARAPNFFDRFDMARQPGWYGAAAGSAPAGSDVLYSNNLSVRREVFEQVGLFDERFLSGEDPELTRRIARAGWVLLRDPGLRVEHAKVHSLRSYLATRFRRGCGSILTDLEAGTLRLRRFVPVPSPAGTLHHWRDFRRLFAGGAAELARFLALSVASRVAEVAGRVYYGLTRGRRRPGLASQPQR